MKANWRTGDKNEAGTMTKTCDIFSDLTEGFDAMKSQREDRLTLRTFKVDTKPAPVDTPQPR